MTADTVVFEIGGVLVDWQPHLAWADDLGENGTRVAQHIRRYTALSQINCLQLGTRFMRSKAETSRCMPSPIGPRKNGLRA